MSQAVIKLSRDLSRKVSALKFSPPVTHCYNPLDYARNPHENYLRQFAQGPKEVLLVGMNPGPFGMAQNGVPFGDIKMVQNWLKVSGAVTAPKDAHPKRPIEGFSCPRSEVSGSRLWGWAQTRFGTTNRFFKRFFVWNYCPLCFLEESGRNRTPDKLPPEERKALFEICDAALLKLTAELKPKYVIGIGNFAATRVRSALPPNTKQTLGVILHPSPASPAANRGWEKQAEAALVKMGIQLP